MGLADRKAIAPVYVPMNNRRAIAPIYVAMDKLIDSIESLRKPIEAMKNSKGAAKFPSVELKQLLLSGEESAYNVRSYPLDTARTNESTGISGDTITARTDGDIAGCSVRLNRIAEDSIPLDFFNPITTQFVDIFLTTSAQSGKTLRLFIGREASAQTLPGTTVITAKQNIYTLSTDKDTHFTGALVQYAKADEDLAGLVSNKLRFTSIAVEADQNLDFWLIFWSKDTKDDTNLDLDAFRGAIEFDLSTYGIRPGGAGQYYLSLEDVNLDYDDEDGTKEIHMSLYNADATAKNAGATGETKFTFTYELRA